MNPSIGIRELKASASAVIRRVRRGETITVTDRRIPVALLVPLKPEAVSDTICELVEAGRLSWSGGKPLGTSRPSRVRGRTVAEAVVGDRR